MVGFTAPNRYQPRAGWKGRLDTWVQFPAGNAGSWQADIGLFWRLLTKQGRTLPEAWTQINMAPNNAITSLDPNGTDTGLIPPDLFSRVLARSRGQLDPNAVAADAIVEPDPTPPPAPEDGFHAPNHYRPSPTWKAKLDGWLDNPPPGAWQRDIHLYWRKVVRENQTPQEAWADLRMAINNARTALDRNSLDRGAIPPELFSRVLARSRAVGINADDDATDVIIDT